MAATSSSVPVSPSSHFYPQPRAPLTRSDTIDLTGDDDLNDNSRQIKRPRNQLGAPGPPISKSPTPSLATPSPTPSNSQINPFPKHPGQVSLRATPAFSMPNIQTQDTYRPHFSGPSTSSAFFPGRPVQSGLAVSPSLTGSAITNSQPRSEQQQPQRRQVIDLTTTPSPPPSTEHVAQPTQPSQNAHHQGPQLDVPPKTPVCIGQLTVTALVLYPISYLERQSSPMMNPNEVDWATVRLHYDATLRQRNPDAEETIQIRTPSSRTQSGEITTGENFGVVEQKVATILGPMLGRGLIRLDAKVRRGVPSLPILPLQMLVHTPNGNIPIVSRYLQQSGLLLDHPTNVWEAERLRHLLYLNPHNPPQGGHARNIIGSSRPTYASAVGNKWSMPSVSGKSVEVQRSQVDEVFKSLRSGDDLEETEPSPDIATKLYPHQKKALTFLLEREREITGPDGKSSSLWLTKRSHDGQHVWYNFVTQKEVTTAPRESKGALLADDMGLGKTITCVSLIASTLEKAREFSQQPLPLPPRPPLEHHNSEPSLSASHFAGSVWGMPDTSAVNDVMSAKQKAKAEKERERLEIEYARARRIKVRSRATLIICPLSTVVNWEDQFKEHWAGEVQVVGGSGLACSTSAQTTEAQVGNSSTYYTEQQQCSDNMVICESNGTPQPQSSLPLDKRKKGNSLRVYIYHGNARRPDPHFLADFDAVITTYATLATEYSKQSKSIMAQEPDDDDEGDSTEGAEAVTETDVHGHQLIQLPKAKRGVKRKKNSALFSGVTEATSPLQSVHWFRVVLDEAHSIKETTTVGSRASCDLIADRRLCLTGTPVQNKLDDVYALIKFLQLDPFDDKSTWQEFIGNPVKYGQPLGVARLQTIMKCITLRRTKETRAQNGQTILTLPPRRDELRYLKFDEHEQRIYDEFFLESRAEFNELSHKNEVMKNYVGILQKILRLRQICDHYELVDGKGPAGPGNYEEITEAISREGITLHRATAIFSLIRDSGTAQCVECGCELGAPVDMSQNDNKLDMDGTAPGTKRGRKVKTAPRAPTRQNSPTGIRPIMSRCQHLFCVQCFQSSIFAHWPNVNQEMKGACTACQATLTPADAVELNPGCSMADFLPKKKGARKEKRQKGVNMDNFHPSTKVKALLGDLVNFSRANPHSANYDPASIELQMVDEKGNELDDNVVKTVVFSQWTTMLDKIEDALEAAGIRYDRLDGTMKRDERTRAMDALKFDPGCEVLLVSLKAGGVGLNLTAAQRVYLMDPYWNPAVENQAVDRIHRLGQNKPVTTVKLIIENTIEARLLEVQRKKTELANMTLGQHLSKAEIHSRRIEELNELFHG